MEYSSSLEEWLQTDPEVTPVTIQTTLSQTYDDWLASFSDEPKSSNKPQTMSISHPATVLSMPY